MNRPAQALFIQMPKEAEAIMIEIMKIIIPMW
jgi:hypothetical protein